MNIESVVALVRRHRNLLILGVLFAAILGGLLSKQTKVEFNAKSTVLLKPNDAAAELNPGRTFTNVDFERYATNEIALAQSQAVQDRAAAALGVSPAALKGALTVTHEAQSDLLSMVATSARLERSVAMANAFADAYLAERKALDDGVLQKKADQITAQVASVTADIGNLEADIAKAPGGSAQQNALIRSRDATLANLTALSQSKIDVEGQIQLNRGSGEVIERAVTGTEVAGVRLPIAVVGGAFVGLLVALGAAATIEQLTPLVRSRNDVTSCGTLLAEIPTDVHLRTELDGLPAITAREDARFAASIRALRTRVQLLSQESPVNRIVVTSPRAGAGATTVGVNLAAAMAQSLIPTVLVSANLRDPEAERLLGFEPGNDIGGLVHLASRPESITTPQSLLLFPTKQDLLQLLPSGDPTGNPSEVVASYGVRLVLSRLEEWGHVVVVDAPPVLDYPDAAVLAASATLVVLVVAEGETRQADLRDAIAVLSDVHLPPVGVVLNQVSGG